MLCEIFSQRLQGFSLSNVYVQIVSAYSCTMRKVNKQTLK